MVHAMASVFRCVVVYWTLAQVIIFCGASDDPVHIQLHLDGKETVKDEEDYDTLPNTKYDSLKQKEQDLVEMWYDSQNAATPMYNDKKAGLKKLYIRGKFTIKVEKIDEQNDKSYFVWDNGRKDAKALGELILKIFDTHAVVIVVFPDDLQTYFGFRFQKEFEEVVQAKNEGITVGRAVINVYLGLGDQNQIKQVDALLEDEIKKQTKGRQWEFENDERYYSIFAKHDINKFSFRTVFSTSWTSDPLPINIHQVKIQEADSVVVKLVSFCTPDQNSLKVGGHTAQDLATILLKLLQVNELKTHPMQRVRVELPEKCKTENGSVEFTGHLVDNLQEKIKEIKFYGKEPMVHINIYDETIINDIAYVKLAYPHDIYAEIKDKITNEINDEHEITISSAKELCIHLHCHGNFSATNSIFCEKDSESLAANLSEYVKSMFQTPNSVPKTVFIQFNGCEAGSDEGKEYVIRFLTKLQELLHTHEITIQESVSYMHKTSQIREYTQVTVPLATRIDSEYEYWPLVNEKEVFGRFTVRTVKTAQGYRAFPVLPFTEYNLIYNE